MTDEITLYHNPRCSKSRQALQLLRDRGVEPHIVEYLKTPPTTEEIERLLKLLGLEPRELMRRKESEYRDLGLDDPARSDDELIAAMHANPRLIERPIAVSGDQAAIGRPPENVLDLLP
ncbi:MAG: arsenate reductase (glutaredoxin) [Xanthomonadales bacterium]|nr:arsenate reductase (glutaredoxin) [Xanthomonadales bacterium]